MSEDERYLSTWGSVLARGAKRVTTMGTDCHRNTFPQLAQDGERLDSYRRMMSWFSNHLIVRTGEPDDVTLKDALRAGRLYGAFENLGYPAGFDFYAEEGDRVEEIGGEVATGAVLVVKMPAVQSIDPKLEQPILRARILRAIEGGFEEVAASSEGELRYLVERSGAYRAEIRMEPRHLSGWLGDYRVLARREVPWVYANPIYVR
jgi:hypothetical protein